jgi:hypothetical protein
VGKSGSEVERGRAVGLRPIFKGPPESVEFAWHPVMTTTPRKTIKLARIRITISYQLAADKTMSLPQKFLEFCQKCYLLPLIASIFVFDYRTL